MSKVNTTKWITTAKWIICDHKKMEHGFIEIFPNKGIYCSNCRTAFHKDELRFKNYCPCCGYKMENNNE